MESEQRSGRGGVLGVSTCALQSWGKVESAIKEG